MVVTRRIRVGQGLFARFLKSREGRIELAIIVTEGATAEGLRDAWQSIDRLREHLRKYQGSDMRDIYSALRYNYAQMKANGWSYNLIAMDINYDCIVNLCRAAEEIDDVNQSTTTSSGRLYAMFLLQAMRMKEVDILNWLIPGIQEIKLGNAPWSIDSGPVDGQRVRDALRQWEKEKETEKVIVKAPPEYRMLEISKVTTPNTDYNNKAKELLNKDYPGVLEKYQQAIRKILEEGGTIGAIHGTG